ncbi:MAG: M13 family metallopeptidase, partial [Chitinophagaceae bacterium]|nr:M13 family metallopeptidase [Chitinophagaceae bacterium]
MPVTVKPPMLAAALLCCAIAFAGNDDKISKEKIKYIDKANMDLSVKPGDNFYRYANGGWIKKNPIPASKTRWGSFDVLREESSKRLQTLLEDAARKTNRDRKTQVIGDFYSSGMDSLAIEARGYQPIKADLARINGLNSYNDVLHEIAFERSNGIGGALFNVGVAPDRKNVSRYIPNIGQGGTTLADRDYYLNNDARSVTIRNAYKTYLEKMFSLTGDDAAAAGMNAAVILKIETALAKAQMSRIQMRDPNAVYNKFAVRDLTATTPNMSWAEILTESKIMGADSVVVANPAFLKTVNEMLASVPVQEWKTYLRWNVIKSAAPYLSSDFVNADFEFNKVVSGQREQTPRWQRMSGLIDRTLGDMVGELYVAKYFKPEAKDYMVKMVDNLQSTFAARIRQLDWMSEKTKAKALEKLNAIAKKIAYPDKWRTYDGVVVNKADFFSNVRTVSAWQYNYNTSRMGKPVDRKEMSMTPPTINASYNPSNNDITFPAGILQFPFFDFGADDAVNYGGIAAV